MTTKRFILATLLNLCVLPGIGHMYMKRKKIGALISVIFAVIIVVFTFHLSIALMELLETAPKGNDVLAMVTHLKMQSSTLMDGPLSTYMLALSCIYFGAVIELTVYFFRNKNKEIPEE